MASGIGFKAASSSRISRTTLIILLAFILLAGCWAYTQLVAYAFGFSDTLGPAAHKHLYWPWRGFVWWFQAGDVYPDLFKRQAVISVSASVMLFSLICLYLASSNQISKGNKSLYGTAAFATFQEVKETGLLHKTVPPAAVVVGGYTHKGVTHILYHDGPEHVLCFAPSRSGKGVSLLLPTLFTWDGSLLMLDIKGEGWSLSSGWRKNYAGNIVLRFDPTDNTNQSAKYNPLAEIRIDPTDEDGTTTSRDVADTQIIAQMLVDPDGRGLNDHWQKTSYALLVGVIIHLLYKHHATNQPTPTLAQVGEALSAPDNLWLEMQDNGFYHGTAHPQAALAALDMVNRADRERSSVLSSAVSYLTLYRDPVLALNTSASDFCAADLMNHDQPVSLYLVVKPSDKERIMPLIRLMVTVFTSRLTTTLEYQDGAPVRHYKHQLLMMLDEFTALRRLELLEQQLAFLAGYGIKCYFLIQDIKQLYRWYSNDESITPNCHIKISFAANELKTAQYISSQTGETTIIKVQTSASGRRMSAILNNVSRHYTEVKRPLLTPDEVLRLPGATKSGDKIIKAGEMLIFVAGYNPIKGTQPLYFQIPAFAERSKVAPPRTSDRCENL